MYTEEQELQLISVDRNGAGSYRGRPVKRKASQRRKRRRRRQMQRFIGTGVLCAAAVALLAVFYQTNWFMELPAIGAAGSFPAKRKKLENAARLRQEEYPKELFEALEQNEELYDFAEHYTERADYLGKEIDLSDSYESGRVPLLMQWDKRWGYELYGDAMIGLAGCGPACMTMAYLYFKEDLSMNPRKMAEYAQDSGYHTTEGTSWSFWTEGASGVGLSGEQVSLSETVMKSVLDKGGLIVCSMAPGDFTTTGHYILLRGYDQDGFFVNDPNRNSNSQKQWDYDTLSTQIKNLWAIYGE